MFDRQLQQTIDKYLETLLAQNLVGLHQICSEFSQEPNDSGEDSSGDMSIGGTKLRDLQNVNKKNLEVVAQDFSFTYKQKAELMSREIQQDLTQHQLITQVNQKLLRMLSLRFGTFVEIVRATHPSYTKELPSTNQVLIDLKNTSLNR